MAVSDVWKQLSEYIEVYTNLNFEEVPSKPGIYAWFYKIRPPSEDLNDLSAEMSSILNYDAQILGKPKKSALIDFNWKSINIEVSETPKSKLKSNSYEYWNRIINNTESKEHMLSILLAASILMPPLYIGKTNNLSRRCNEHRLGKKEEDNSFRKRFEKFTSEPNIINNKEFLSKKVDDLIFVCIKTDAEGAQSDMDGDEFATFIEQILIILSKPPYGGVI